MICEHSSRSSVWGSCTQKVVITPVLCATAIFCKMQLLDRMFYCAGERCHSEKCIHYAPWSGKGKEDSCHPSASHVMLRVAVADMLNVGAGMSWHAGSDKQGFGFVVNECIY